MARLSLSGLFALSLVLAAVTPSPVLASSDESPLYPQSWKLPDDGDLSDLIGEPNGRTELAIPAAEAFIRMMAVWEHFKVLDEDGAQRSLTSLDGQQTAAGARKLLPTLDPKGMFSRLAVIDDAKVACYQDRGSKLTSDWQVRLAPADGPDPADPGAPPSPSSDDDLGGPDFNTRILSAKEHSPADRPLMGLRIAIDPGHMGGDIWDQRTGKFVRDRAGRKVSEGVIALQTAMLVETELKRLGAEVFLTRRTLDAVSDLDFATFDMAPYARQEFAENSLEPWFQALLARAPVGPRLFASFARNAKVRAIFANSTANRWAYFVLNADLWARVDKINAFKPDIFFDIHFDTVDPPGRSTGVNPRRHDQTKAYVVGSYEASELSTRRQRRLFAEHLLHQRSWNASLALGQSIISELKAQLGLEYGNAGGGTSAQYAPGIFARNLNVTRGVTRTAATYLETLHYNDPVEFAALLRRDFTMPIGGVDMPCSSRLVEVANAIRDGVVAFVRNYSDTGGSPGSGDPRTREPALPAPSPSPRIFRAVP